MLYERWRQIAREHATELAVWDVTANERITFGELERSVEDTIAPGGTVLWPQGHGPEFVRMVLLGWKHGRVVFPLESDQPRPPIGALPEGCAHLKMTSATTGPPRLIVFREEQLFADARN